MSYWKTRNTFLQPRRSGRVTQASPVHCPNFIDQCPHFLKPGGHMTHSGQFLLQPKKNQIWFWVLLIIMEQDTTVILHQCDNHSFKKHECFIW